MNTFNSRSRSSLRGATTFLAAASLLALSACVVVPVDPRTGQPYPVSSRDAAVAQGYTVASPVIAPPVVAQPSQPTLLAVRLYPVNAQAGKAGMLSAQVIDNNGGHGSFSVPYLGDVLQGEATRVDAGFAGFGAVYQKVLGPSQRTYSGRRGIANAYGPRGVNAQCEYVLTAATAGTGVCQFSDGAQYQMHFGG